MRTSVTWRIFASGAGVFVAAGLALAITPATVSNEIEHDQLAVLIAGTIVFLAIHYVLLRRTLRPLSTLIADMRRVDVLAPGTRVPVPRASTSNEVEQLAAAFNDMAARLESERRTSAEATYAAIEDERRRIAGDLHDQIGQDLTALLMQLDRMRDHPDAAAARELTREILDEVRGVVFELRPDPVDELGLAGGLESMCARLRSAGPPEIVCVVDDGVPKLHRDAETAVYRIAQEALTNALRHAGAQRITVALRPASPPDAVMLEVVDDGRPTKDAIGGSGLRGMRERALSIGARITIGTGEAGGTAVTLVVPGETRA